LLGEHGLAMWVEIGAHRVLFDTGQGLVPLHNAKQLGIRLEKAEAVVLSHGHYDHTGGLSVALDRARNAKVYAHPEVFRPRFVRDSDGTTRKVGMREADRDAAQKRAPDIIETTRPTEVLEGLCVTGLIPRTTEYERTSGPFFLDNACREPDALNDDQALFFESEKGTVVLLGCAHAGVVNTLEYVRRLTNGNPIHAVIGGMHLASASEDRVRQTCVALRELGVRRVGPCHCTGLAATATLWQDFREGLINAYVGTIFEV